MEKSKTEVTLITKMDSEYKSYYRDLLRGTGPL